jgi:rhamnosyltransferase
MAISDGVFVSGPARPSAAARNVLAVVVTYNPDDDLELNLRSIRAEIETVVVIDNGSANVAAVALAARAAGCSLRRNEANLGVAAALSQAARLALEMKVAWLASFDQDSLIPTGSIAGLFEVLALQPDPDRVAVLAMSHRDRSTGRDYHHGWDILEETPLWRSVRMTITSGSLVRTEVFKTVGLFDDALFIDSVDHEFCMRARRHGWRVIEGRAQILVHSIGRLTEHRMLGRRVGCTNHAPARRYYITRNTLEIARRYMFSEPLWSIMSIYVLMGGAVITLTFEDQRAAKAMAMLAGLRDFVLRRFGPR